MTSFRIRAHPLTAPDFLSKPVNVRIERPLLVDRFIGILSFFMRIVDFTGVYFATFAFTFSRTTVKHTSSFFYIVRPPPPLKLLRLIFPGPLTITFYPAKQVRFGYITLLSIESLSAINKDKNRWKRTLIQCINPPKN